MTITLILITIAFFAFLALTSKYLEQCKKCDSLQKRYDELHSEKFLLLENCNRIRIQFQELNDRAELLQEIAGKNQSLAKTRETENEGLKQQIQKLTSISKEQDTIKKRKLSKPKAKK